MQKKILIIRNAYSYDFGGGERFPVNLSLELIDHGYHPVLISHSPKLLSLAKDNGLKTIKGWWWKRQDFSGKRVLLFPLYLLWQLILFVYYISLIIRFNPEALHIQSRDDFIAATFAGKLCRKRIVWTDHADLKYIWQNHAVWYKNPVGKLVYLANKLANRITLVSISEKKLIEEQLQKKLTNKYIVIHNGVNPLNIDPVERSQPDKDAIIFVATSRLVTAKGIGELIEAFNILPAKLDIRLWLLGEGKQEDTFKKQANGNKNILFLGFPENALSHVAAADIFVHPSYHEGFSISLVEAAMLGKPIIACDIGGNPEIVNNNVNGILVPAHDSRALSEAMLRLARDSSLRSEYGKAAHAVYEKEFVFEKIVRERFIPLYEK